MHYIDGFLFTQASEQAVAEVLKSQGLDEKQEAGVRSYVRTKYIQGCYVGVLWGTLGGFFIAMMVAKVF